MHWQPRARKYEQTTGAPGGLTPPRFLPPAHIQLHLVKPGDGWVGGQTAAACLIFSVTFCKSKPRVGKGPLGPQCVACPSSLDPGTNIRAPSISRASD